MKLGLQPIQETRERPSKFERICDFAISRDKLMIETQKYGNYARTLKVSHGSPGWVKDLISKQGTLIKVQFRDIS